ncbi:MAG: hypothetical protein KL785_08780 [Brevundimonas sp.]|nr:hypothetical protein [Brevundimonas sp.]
MTTPESNSDIRRQGPLNPEAGDGVVVVENPPSAPMHMTPDEADISGIRMLDAADRSRKPPPAGGAKARPGGDSGQ